MKLRALLYAIVISCLPVAAAECQTLEYVRDNVATWTPPGIIKEMDKKETEAFLELYNALPPVSDVHGDYSVMISHPQKPNVVYVYFRENCAIETLFMPRNIFDRLYDTALPKPEGQKA